MYLINKYTSIYNLIIEKAQKRILIFYKEKHHIIPRSLGGNDDPANLVELTAREHFICHLLLTKMTSGHNKSKMCQAAWMMASVAGKGQDRYKVNNRTYERLRLAMSAIKKEKSTWNKGIQPSIETRLKLRKAALTHLVTQGKISQEEADYKNSLPLPEVKEYKKRKPKEPTVARVSHGKSGWKWSKEARDKLSAQRMGRTPWNKGRSLTQS